MWVANCCNNASLLSVINLCTVSLTQLSFTDCVGMELKMPPDTTKYESNRKEDYYCIVICKFM